MKKILILLAIVSAIIVVGCRTETDDPISTPTQAETETNEVEPGEVEVPK